MVSPRRSRWSQTRGCWMFWDSERKQEYSYNPRSDKLEYPDRTRPRTFPKADYNYPPPEPQQGSSSSEQPNLHLPGVLTTCRDIEEGQVGTLRFLAFEELYLRPHGGLNNPMLIRSMVKVLRSSMAKALLSSTARAHHGTRRSTQDPGPSRSPETSSGARDEDSLAQRMEQTSIQGPSAGDFDPRSVLIYNEKLRRTAMVPAAQQELAVLFPDYVLRPRRFFVFGRVFMVLWAEPAGENATTNVPSIERPDASLIPSRFKGEMVYSKVRRFVVIREAGDHCNVIPIVSYGGQGVGKRGVTKSDHSIIHTTTKPPREMSGETPAPREEGMRSPIRVTPDNPVTNRLDEQSRLNYSKVSSIPHNVKVKPVGVVHPGSMRALRSNFYGVWGGHGGHDEPSSDSSDSDDDPKGKKPARATTRSKGKGKEPVTDSKGSSSKGKEAVRGSGKHKSQSAAQAIPREASGQSAYTPSTIDPKPAMWARNGVEGLLAQGQSMEQAVNTLARSLQRSTPGTTLESAIRSIHQLLAQSNTILAQRQEESSDESER
ncbi:unnamed protein product [Zymoseptoria tritici ST99CH_1E4]|uniref:DUF6590 domain-containing protein n=1 Tax=Zymoseptoria tritici ST99CH_1E4 TaxID=1276532 RepID=A0A2H1G6X7_ZYMTR|nr:unnamed protein product [Zymoseptoria tritici ST99CH_1E4]